MGGGNGGESNDAGPHYVHSCQLDKVHCATLANLAFTHTSLLTKLQS